MDVFIDTPQRMAARDRARSPHPRDGREFDLDEAPGFGCAALEPVASEEVGARGAAFLDGSAGIGPLAVEAYRDAREHDTRRVRRARLRGVLRALGLVIVVPLAMAALFIASYALTCIVNGASPEELSALMENLFARVGGFISQLPGAWRG